MQCGVTVRVGIHNRHVLLSVMLGRVTPPPYDIPVRADCQRCAQRKYSQAERIVSEWSVSLLMCRMFGNVTE